MSAPDPSNLRRQFRLPAEDEAFLNQLSRPWETLAQNGQRWVIIYGGKVPLGYNVGIADVAIMMAPGYPPGPLDMAYFCPHLSRADGRVPPNTQGRTNIDGRSWQAWSRHRTEGNPWVPGEDNFESHYYYMQEWLTLELKR